MTKIELIKLLEPISDDAVIDVKCCDCVRFFGIDGLHIPRGTVNLVALTTKIAR